MLVQHAGREVSTLHPAYVGLAYFVVPLLYVSSIWLLSRQIFQDGRVILLGVIVAAFAPAIFQNLKDPGFLEITAYGLYLLAAYIHYLRTGTERAFLLFALSLLVMAVSAGFPVVVWNLWFLPAVIIGPLFANKQYRTLLKTRLANTGPMRLSVLAVATCFGLLPKLLIYVSHRSDFIRFGQTGTIYSLASIHPGNPWQILLSSVPGIGFRNLPGADFSSFVAAPDLFWPHPNYLGLMAVPLIIFGLIWGRPLWRNLVLGAICFLFLSVLLGGFSPLVSLLLILIPPFRAANHYFDIYYGFGGTAVMIMALMLGADAFISRHDLRKRFVGIFALVVTLSLGMTCVNFPERKDIMGAFTGFYFLLALLIGISLWTLATTKVKRQRRFHTILILACVLIDVSTSHWMFVQKNLGIMNNASLDRKAANDLGLIDDRTEMGLNVAFYLKKSHELKDLGADQLPEVSVFSRYYVSDTVAKEDLARAMATKDPSLQATTDFSGSAEEKSFLASSPLGLGVDTSDTKPMIHWIDFNTFDVTLERPIPGLLFVRSSMDDSWHATSNDHPIRIFRSLGNFKMVALEPGMTKITFHFFPKSIALTLVLAYILIFIVIGRYLFLGSAMQMRFNRKTL